MSAVRTWGSRLPAPLQTIRFRLALLYSTVLFALLAAVLGGTYLVVEASTDPKAVSKQYEAQISKRKPNGVLVPIDRIEVAAVSEIEGEVNLRTLETLRTWSAVALGGLFVLSLGTGWVLSGRVLRPIRSITTTAQEIQATDLSRRIALGGPHDELRGLADTVDSMLDRLEEAFRAQRQLIDDASHELRSPLAIIRASLDASLEPDDVGEAERRRAVAVIDRATTRMTTLVEDLLATARREAPAMLDADVDLAAVAREATEDYALLAAERNLRLQVSAGPVPQVTGDHEALRRAVSNLLSNAVRLAPTGSTVTVSTATSGGSALISVTDEGPGIAADDQDRVFDRFWRGSGSSGRERRSGLGLAIVRQIAESHRGSVTLTSSPAGSTFTLRLPT